MRIATILRALLLAALLPGARLLQSQEIVNKFQIRIGSGAATGSEEHTIEKSGSGYRLTSTTRLSQMGQQVEMIQEQILAADWSPERYKLEVGVAGLKQVVEAWKEGDQIQMRGSAGGQSKSQTVPIRPRTLVLDNVMVSHFQILLNAFAAEKEKSAEWRFLVPQVLMAINGKLAETKTEAGTWNGKNIQVRKYTLELANVIEEFWAEADSNRLMRVYVPVQKVELVREGFALTPGAAGEARTPAAGNERGVSFPSGSLRVPGTLCLPGKAAARVPIVVLVHGSGPNDRDESIGPNKPFRDLAQGLAAAGIATLRYDKRTFAFKQQINPKTLTLDQEVTDDAVAALEYCRTLAEIDPGRIFVLGHSMGGMMTPYIAPRFPPLRGAVLMAACARPLDELILEQTAFQSRIAGVAETELAASLQKLKGAFARIRSGEAADDEVVLFAPARYWRECFKLNVPKALAGLKLPVLVLQGGKDVQVTKADYDQIQNAFSASATKGNVFRWFPNLNHLFMEVTGRATGSEYGLAGIVSKEVIETIATWIMEIGGRNQGTDQ
jgi:pimeloyl-ACP methyl ester carboxylesterase